MVEKFKRNMAALLGNSSRGIVREIGVSQLSSFPAWIGYHSQLRNEFDVFRDFDFKKHREPMSVVSRTIGVDTTLTRQKSSTACGVATVVTRRCWGGWKIVSIDSNESCFLLERRIFDEILGKPVENRVV